MKDMTLNDFLSFELVRVGEYVINVSNLMMILFIVIATLLVLRIVKGFIIRRLIRKMDAGKRHSIYKILSYIIWVVSICLMLEQVGVNVTIMVASSAALFIGIGLGLQEMFKDLASGIILLFEGTIQVGDVVEVDGLVGKVEEIGLRTSKVLTRGDIVMIIPNHKFVAERVINWSHNYSKTRFDVSVGVAYGSDTALVKSTLLGCCSDMELILKEPEPFVRFTNFGDSSLDFQLFFWSEHVFEIEGIKSDLRFKIDQRFRENNIQIPFPQRDLHIKSGLKGL